MLPKIDPKTAALLKELLPDFNPIVDPIRLQGVPRQTINRLDLRASEAPRESIVKLKLPTAAGAEYFFTICLMEDGERQIGAQLIAPDDDRTYFWYRPFELAMFRGNEDRLVEQFCKTLEILLTHQTRIIQKKGLLFWTFRCEFKQGGKWKNVSGHLALRAGGFNPPKIDCRTHDYHSAPISTVRFTR